MRTASVEDVAIWLLFAMAMFGCVVVGLLMSYVI
jgi:hypothetical protein